MAAVTPTVGWIGTGRMGYQLALRLLNAGYDVAAYNRTRAKAEPLAEHGAKIVDSPADLAGRDIVFIMVSADKDLEAVISGPARAAHRRRQAQGHRRLLHRVARGVGARPRPSSRRTACSSSPPRSAATPRSSRPASSPSPPRGRAPRSTRPSRCSPTWGRGVTYVGEGEGARLVKIAHNVFLGVVIQSLAEITVLAERGGVSRAAFLDFLNDSVLGSAFTRYKSPALVNLDFHPTFTNVLLRKDLQLGLSAGKELGVPMPLAAAADMLIAQAIGAGYTEDDFATLVLEQARRSGYQIEPENVPVDDGLAAEEA